MDTYSDLREATERQGWELTSDGQHWCPAHASPSLAAVIIREAINERENSTTTVAAAKAAARTLEDAFLMIPRDKIIHGANSRDLRATDMIVRYRDAR